MEQNYYRSFKRFVLLCCGFTICAAQKDITLSIFTVTSKSITLRWSGYTGASSYKVIATPKNSPEPSAFAQFDGNTVMGSLNFLSPNTEYTVTVEAMRNTATVLSSAEIEGTTAPDVPTIDEAYSKNSDSITVEFGEVVGASGYIIRAESKIEGFFSETAVSGSRGTVLNLQPYTEYNLSVMSVNSGGRSQPSKPVGAKTVVATPRLSATSPSNNTIDLTWDRVEQAVMYSVTLMDVPNAQVTFNTTNTFATFSELMPGTTYCIRANAWDVDGRPSGENITCQITRPPIPCCVEVAVVGRSSIGITIYWESVQGADEYIVLSSTGQNCNSNDTSCNIAPLSCSQNHSITVTAKNMAGSSDPSVPESFLTYPCPVQSMWVEEPSPGSCSLMWGEVPWTDYYLAYVKKDDGSESMCNTTTNVCQFSCPCSLTFLIMVFAYNKAGPSPPGAVLNYTTVPCCPEDVSVLLVSTETLEIIWSPVHGAEVYETEAFGGSNLVQCNDTAPVCALSDLRCNTGYRVVVKPCNEVRGCNHSCKPHTGETAPCSTEILSITQDNTSSFNISWTASNREADYTVTVAGETDSYSCRSSGTSCQVLGLPCGSTYKVSVFARSSVGQSLPSFTVPLETGPCCPQKLTVAQVTQAMSNVTWSAALGARSFMTSLTSPRGEARCHTLDLHCLMGCITCGTNYSVSLEAISATGHRSECTYHGFSSSSCCPSSVRLYRMSNNTIRVYWRSSSGSMTADLYGSQANYTCTVPAGASSCDVSDVTCGDVYTVVVAPISRDGTKVQFCPRRMYMVSCSGSSVGMVIYRGKRSVK